MAESYVQVAPDSTGKYIRNQSLYVPVDLFDGVGPRTTLVQEQTVTLADPFSGKVVNPDLEPHLERFADAQARIAELLEMLLGVSGSLVGGDHSPEPHVLKGTANLPALSGALNQPVPLVGDGFGRQIVLPHATRDMIGTQYTTLNSLSETTIVTAGSGYNDPIGFIFANNTGTATQIDLRDATGGSIRLSFYSPATSAPTGMSLPIPIPQTTPQQNWTAQLSGSGAVVLAFVMFVRYR